MRTGFWSGGLKRVSEDGREILKFVLIIEYEIMVRINILKGSDQWRPFVNTAVNVRFS
jgi:hypothetical protein